MIRRIDIIAGTYERAKQDALEGRLNLRPSCYPQQDSICPNGIDQTIFHDAPRKMRLEPGANRVGPRKKSGTITSGKITIDQRLYMFANDSDDMLSMWGGKK